MNAIIALPIFIINLLLFVYYLETNTYPWILIGFQIIEVIVIFYWLFHWRKLITKYRIDLAIGLGLFVISLMVYLYKISVITPGVWNDEIAVGFMSERLYTANSFTPFTFENYGHPTPILYVIGFVTKTFGRTILNLRLTSVISASLGVLFFYIFSRLNFKRITATPATLLFAFSYMYIVVTRFSYEMTAAIAVEIVCLIFAVLYWHSKNIKYLIGLGLAVGIGFYTYLGFRTIGITFIVIILLKIMANKALLYKKLQHVLLLFLTVFIVATPLLSYTLHYPDQIMARTKSVSLFHQRLSITELKKELSGNIARTSAMFTTVGDPNPRHNPAGTTPFEILTIGLLIIGTITLLLQNKQRHVLGVAGALILVSLINDILTIEQIPEFHYYGLGHPNTLRVAGLLPFFYWIIGYGLSGIAYLFRKKVIDIILTIGLSLIIITIHLNRYFNQPYLAYNYNANGVRMLQIANLINQGGTKTVAVSDSIAKDERIKYFVNKNVKLTKFSPLSISSKLTIIDVRENMEAAKNIVDKYAKNNLYQIRFLDNPWKQTEAVIVTKLSD